MYAQQNYYYSYHAVAWQYSQTGTTSPVKNPCTIHDEVQMVYHQLLVYGEGNFVVLLKLAPWCPTLHSFRAVTFTE